MKSDGQLGPRPLLIVVSAPSGAGKTTLCERLLAACPGIVYSVSCTTRSPRGSELDGVDYHFLTDEEFERRAQADEFLEHARVHGCRYGTRRAAVVDAMHRQQSVLMDIDVQGAAQIRAAWRAAPEGDPLRAGFVDVFIAPPSLEALRRRLVARGEDLPEVIERRLRNAEGEMKRAGEFRYVIVNDDLEAACARLRDIVMKESGRHG